MQGQKLVCFGPQHGFKKFGRNGTEVCELFPQIGSVVDEICLIRSMTTEAINHDPAHMFMNTGSQIAGRPSMAPGRLTASAPTRRPARIRRPDFPGQGGQNQPIAARQWAAGFCPAVFKVCISAARAIPSSISAIPRA